MGSPPKRYSPPIPPRKESVSRTPTWRSFGRIDSQKFRFLGLKSAGFDSSNATETKNELRITKKFSRGIWDPFGAGRKNFDHPAPKRSILGVQKFLQNRLFGLISAVFDSGGPIWSQKGLGGTKNFLRELWNPFGADQKNFDHPTPNRSFWGLQKFLPTQFGPFWSKKFF